MGRDRVKVYLGANSIISSLGSTTAENYGAIRQYTTNLTKFVDGTPLCLIDKTRLDFSGLDSYSFVEQLAILSLRDTINSSKVGMDDSRTLLILSTTKGDVEALNSDFDNCYLWRLAEKLEEYFECKNQPLIVSNACISGVAAAVIAARMIEEGDYDTVYVVGVDVVSEFVVSGFQSFKSLTPTFCRPYDKARDGLTIGEACATLMLTNKRGLSESGVVISGGAISDDANHISGPSRTGDGLFYAMRGAMQKAGLTPEDIDLVNLHGTATPYNDEMESKAMELASLRGVPCNSLKPYLGHTLGASGVVEIILTMEQIIHQEVIGVKGFDECGLPYELNVSAKHRNKDIRHALKSASGFGGTNAVVVLSKEELVDNQVEILQFQDVECEGLAHIEIKKQEVEEFDTYIRREYKSLGRSNMKFFKMDRLSKLGYVASCKLLDGVDLNELTPNRVAIVIANSSSSLDTDIRHQEVLNQRLSGGTSPAIFVYTLANVMAAEMAICHKFQGELSLFIQREKSLSFVESYSKRLIERGEYDAVLCGWCELLNEDYNADLKFFKRK